MADAESRNLLLMLRRKKQIPHCVRNDEPVELNSHFPNPFPALPEAPLFDATPLNREIYSRCGGVWMGVKALLPILEVLVAQMAQVIGSVQL